MNRCVIALLACLVASLAPAPKVSAASPFSTGFTYQGRIEINGQPLSGLVTLQVGLFDAPSGGLAVGTAIELANVSVDAGVFTVLLNETGQFGPAAYAGGPRYLELRVKAPSEANFTLIPGRVPLNPTPHSATAGAIGSRLLPSPLLFVDAEDRIGIATTNPKADLDLKGNLYVDPRLWGGTPTVTLAVGDSDTGIHTPIDGVISIFSNNFEAMKASPGGGISLTGRPGSASFPGAVSHGEPIVLAAGDAARAGFSSAAAGSIVLRHGAGVPGDVARDEIPPGGVIVTANSEDALLKIDAQANNYSSINFAMNGVDKWGMGRGPNNEFYIDEAGVDRRMTMIEGGSVAIGGSSPILGIRLDVQGLLRCAGFVNLSSARYKHDIRPLDSALDRVAALRPVRFTWNDGQDAALGEMAGKHDIGMIAEEVAEVFPDAVSRAGGKIEGINYTSITAYAVQAIKEQRELLREKDRQIEELNARLERLERAMMNPSLK